VWSALPGDLSRAQSLVLVFSACVWCVCVCSNANQVWSTLTHVTVMTVGEYLTVVQFAPQDAGVVA